MRRGRLDCEASGKAQRNTPELELFETTMKAPNKKPLQNMTFYLDLKGYGGLKLLTNDIKCLGGVVETFLCKDLTFVVTNRSDWKRQIRDSSADSFHRSPSSGTPNFQLVAKRMLNSPCNPEPDKIVPNSVKSRGSTLLEKAKKSNMRKPGDVIQFAHRWGVKIVHLLAFSRWIKKLKSQNNAGTADSHKRSQKLKPSSVSLGTKLVLPYLKFEDKNAQYRPQYQQFRDWPVLNTLVIHSRSPFCKVERLGTPIDENMKPNNEKPFVEKKFNETVNVQKVSYGHHTHRDTIKVLGKKPGYCETCCGQYEDAFIHVQSKEHQKHENAPGFYAKLDKRIAMLPDIADLAKLFSRKLEMNETSSTCYKRSLLNSAIPNKRSTQKPDHTSSTLKRKNIHAYDGISAAHSTYNEFESPIGKKLKPNQVCKSTSELNKNCDAENNSNMENRYEENNHDRPLISAQQIQNMNQNSGKTVIRRTNDFHFDTANEYSGPKLVNAGVEDTLLGDSGPPNHRKVLKPIDLNTFDMSRNANISPIVLKNVNSNISPAKKPVGTKVLRSTAQRRLSSQSQSSGSSPTIMTSSKTPSSRDKRLQSSSPISRNKKVRKIRDDWPRRVLCLNNEAVSTASHNSSVEVKFTDPIQQNRLQATSSLPVQQEPNAFINQLNIDHCANDTTLTTRADSAAAVADKDSLTASESGLNIYASSHNPKESFPMNEVIRGDEKKNCISNIKKDSKAAENGSNDMIILNHMGTEIIDMFDNYFSDESMCISIGSVLDKLTSAYDEFANHKDNFSKLPVEDTNSRGANSFTAETNCALMSVNGITMVSSIQNTGSGSNDIPSLPKCILKKIQGATGSSWTVHVMDSSDRNHN